MTRVAKVRMSCIFKPMIAAVLCFMAAGQLGVTQTAPPTGQLFHASTPLPSFDVVSIRRVNGNAPAGSIKVLGDGIVMRGTPLKQIIPWAFGVASDSQFSGGPGWMESATFDIQAKVDEPRATELSKLPPDQRNDLIRAMIQELLEERFKLKVAFPIKEQTVYELTVAKGGLKCPRQRFRPRLLRRRRLDSSRRHRRQCCRRRLCRKLRIARPVLLKVTFTLKLRRWLSWPAS